MELLLKYTKPIMLVVTGFCLLNVLVVGLFLGSWTDALLLGLSRLTWGYIYIGGGILGITALSTLIQLSMIGLIRDPALLSFEERRRLARLGLTTLCLGSLMMGAWMIERMVLNRVEYNQEIDFGFILMLFMGLMMQAVFWCFWQWFRDLKLFRPLEAEAIFGKS